MAVIGDQGVCEPTESAKPSPQPDALHHITTHINTIIYSVRYCFATEHPWPEGWGGTDARSAGSLRPATRVWALGEPTCNGARGVEHSGAGSPATMHFRLQSETRPCRRQIICAPSQRRKTWVRIRRPRVMPTRSIGAPKQQMPSSWTTPSVLTCGLACVAFAIG